MDAQPGGIRGLNWIRENSKYQNRRRNVAFFRA